MAHPSRNTRSRRGRAGVCLSVVCLAACGQSDGTRLTAVDAGPSGGGGQGDPGTPGLEVLYEGEDTPHSVAFDESYLYWASRVGLRRAPIDGGEPVTLAVLDALQAFAPVGDFVYFYESASYLRSEVGRVPRAGGELSWLADAPGATGLAGGGGHVVWSDTNGFMSGSGVLYRVEADGSQTALARDLIFPRNLTLAGDHVYFSDGLAASCPDTADAACAENGIYRVPLAGGAPERVVSSIVGSNPVWNEGAMFWLAGNPRAFDVMQQPAGGAPQMLARLSLDSPSAGVGLHADAEALYWASGSRLLRLPFSSLQIERLASGLDDTTGMALRGEWVYLAEHTRGRIVRINKDGSAYRPRSEPISGPCPAPVGSAEELALTPRAQPNLELLAFELEPENMVASQATYERLESDVTAIRNLEPSLVSVTYLESGDGRRIQLQLSSEAMQAFGDGQYTAWDCLNGAYGLRDFTSYGMTVDLVLDGIYNLPHVVERYLQLPGVTGGHGGFRSLDGPTICVARDGSRYDYVFDDTGGYCPEPCREHHAYHFSSEISGQVTRLAEWDSTSGAPVPEWFGAVCDFQPRVGGL